MKDGMIIEEAGAAGLAADLSRKLAVAQSEPKVGKYLDASPYVILRDSAGGERIEHISGTIAPPARKAGTVELDDVESFIGYVNRYKTPGSVIYGKIAPAQFVAVLNDHNHSQDGGPTPGLAGPRDFRADYPISFSREWATWSNHNGAGAGFKSTEAFALFVEDNAPDIIRPEAAKMLQIALNFRVNQGVNFVSANRLQDGNVDFVYSSTVDAQAKGSDGKKLMIPETFTIEVPIFHGIAQERVKIDARFRFRLEQGRLSLWYDLVRPARAVEDAYRKLWERVKKETGCPMFLGSP